MQEPALVLIPNAGLGLLAAALRRRLKQVVWARLAPFGLSPQQFWVLLVLRDQGPHSLHTLAQQVWMDDPTASRVVKTLTQRGWLTSRSDPAHGRRLLIDLAPSALPRVAELQALANELRESMATGLSAEEQAAVRHGLTTMISNLDGLLATLPPSAAAQAAS
jgi:DNA-binding MarR family transcriptional regulator